ncbi:PREDICTED: G2/M phase-specific E3 ubiquitin-protein ligase-like [Amphimedon queenslandica]|uniref:HECT domain-containing protein n=1 Tax=Amphimedon queenslandica TaxID=400682 RepID=A0AAN0IP25_AMPQE|nr:PREDICTED: G2/M phase-specific E3 ubiquitin-protein ligase-like [Amphimedon queenslandica]|eukprot:XP_011405992.1 PREDICTED: G2/M phase-specific E3 ubiquitin-protein ligase-like [Amphimedon queenslandica]
MAFNPIFPFVVNFADEPGMDSGSPIRKLFRLFKHSLQQQPHLFASTDVGLVPMHNDLAVIKGDFEAAGKVLATSCLFEGPTLQCFSRFVAEFIVCDRVQSTLDVECITDHEVKRKILKISSANSDEFQQLVTSEDYSFQYECGFNKVIKFSNKRKFVNCALMHYTLFNIHSELTSLRKGFMKTLDFDKFAEANPEILLGILRFQPNKKITASAFIELVSPTYCPIDRAQQERTMTFLFSFVHSCNCEGSPNGVSVGDIFSFITGASTIPVVGLEENITVKFTDENCIPYASTCSPTLTIPYKIESQNKFNEAFISHLLCYVLFIYSLL